MFKHHRPLATAALAVAALVPATAAQAATHKATLGYGGKPPAGTPEAAQLFAFFPSKLTIHAGDKVKYTVPGFGVPYSGPKSKIQSLPAFDAATKVSGVNDPAGNPFWFNGTAATPHINPFYLANAGDGKVHKGQKDVDHGALSLGPAKPYVLSFAKPGSYKIVDAIHPKVAQTVVVKPKAAKLPTASAVKRSIAKELTGLVKEAKKQANYTAPANTLAIGHDSSHVGLYEFLPGNLTVAAGTPITVDAGSNVDDVHDIAIGPDAYMKNAASNLFQPGPAGVTLGAEGIYPSQPGALTFDGTQNGGFVSTGAFDTDPKSPLPSKTTITFTKPGTYHYVCLFHSDGVQGMSGTITVQ